MRLETCLVIAFTMGATIVDVGAVDQKEPGRSSIALTETTEVTLILLDVEVTDREGRPIQGLSRRDFTARLDGRPRPIYSVDDLCDCAQPLPASATRTVDAAEPPAMGSQPPSAMPAERVRFILYFDYSQLGQGGRITAMKEAKRWIQVTMRPEDEVMLVAFSTAAGLRTLSVFTADRARLLGAVDQAFKDPLFMDPFPTLLEGRIEECRVDRRACIMNAADEYHHGRRSLTALQRFMAGLDQVPGHKSLIYFHENGNIQPGAFYHVKTSDHARRLEEIGAESATSRVAVFPATVGDFNLLGFELADYTGGKHNLTGAGLSSLTDAARSRCACIYRIAIEPPDDGRRRIYPISISVNGRALPGSYRVLSLTPMDRWLRSAQAVLDNPESAQDLFVTAGLIPVNLRDGRWDLKAQVALRLGSLTMLPSSGGGIGKWEIGAALVRDGGKDSWEMLGHSELHGGGDTTSDTWVVHERTFHGLPKGSYHLAAFVRDRTANVFGGAEAILALPKPGTDGIAGPILMRPGLRQIVSTLPLMRQKQLEPVMETRVVTDSLPAGSQLIEHPATLVAMTWICSRREMGSTSPSRFISGNGVPLFRFDKPVPEPFGDCSRIIDRIERWSPETGPHAYHFRWTSKDGSGAALAEVPFEVGTSSSASRDVRAQPSRP